MMPFLLGIVLLLISAFFCRYGKLFNKTINEKIFIIISFVILFILMGLKSPSLGTDSETYNNMFIRIGQKSSFVDAISVSGISAPGYVFFCWILYKIFPFVQARIIGVSLVILVGMFRFIKKTSNNIFFSILLYVSLTFYVQGFNISRQYFAMVILLNAFVEWQKNRKSIRGWGMFVVAISIHSIAFLGVVAWVLIDNTIDYKNDKQVKRLIFKSVFLGFLVILTQTQLLGVFLQAFPIYNNYFGNRASNQFLDQGQGRTIIIIFGYLAYVIYSIILIKKCNKYIDRYKHDIEQLPLMLFSVIIGIFGAGYPTILRINLLFSATSVTFIPNTLMISKKSIRMLLSILTLILTFAYLTIYMIEDKSDIVPYNFFWE